jgi:putative ABC transport system ATP-binding protein
MLYELKDCSIGYGRKKLVSSVNLEIPEGSFTVFAGKSGSGKSTLLFSLAGLLKPITGDVFFQKRSLYSFGELGLGKYRRDNIAFLFQDFRLLPFLSLEKNVRMPSYFSGARVEKGYLDQLLQEFGLSHRRKALPKYLSGGESQRAALARALLTSPKVLFLDEPTGNLDEQTEEEILELLLRKKEDGLNLVCVTHSSYVMSKADKVYQIEDDELVLR